MVGSLSAEGLDTIGYHPEYMKGCVIDTRHTRHAETAGAKGFSPQEPLQMWTDILARGIPAGDVRLLGFGGRTISALEYQLALALGAEVGVLEDSGKAVEELLGDCFWPGTGKLLRLPPDPMSLKAFLAPRLEMPPGKTDEAARAVHEKYRADNKHELVDPSMRPWEDLDEELRDSNRQQAAYAAEEDVLLRIESPSAVRNARLTNRWIPNDGNG